MELKTKPHNPLYSLMKLGTEDITKHETMRNAKMKKSSALRRERERTRMTIRQKASLLNGSICEDNLCF